MSNVLTFREITTAEAKVLVLSKHYARRMPSVSWAFGAFDALGSLVGVLTVGKPASRPLCVGVCGVDYAPNVYELSRLIFSKDVLYGESQLIGFALRELKRHNVILVSFADSGMGHVGYVYQATNFLYTGTTKERTDKWVPYGKHPRHYDSSNEHLRVVRTAKHRYIYFAGDKRFKRDALRALNYPQEPYPKGDNALYDLDNPGFGRWVENRLAGTRYWESPVDVQLEVA